MAFQKCLIALSVIAAAYAAPTNKYKNDCWKKRPVSLAPGAASFTQYVPGAGIDKFTPFETVLKDGFLEVDCIKDYMYESGDKFGDNRHNYKLADVSGVSIVPYADVVAKEDQKPMKASVCFEFCRTVPNMGFFGLVNGKCYCSPYWKKAAGDSSMCDSVCPGDSTTMCGGKSKSSVFSMHFCDSTSSDLGDATGEASKLAGSLDKKVKKATDDAKDMQKTAAALQKVFGGVGDSGAADLMQEAKVTAGELEKVAKAGKAASEELTELQKSGEGIKDFKDPAEVTKAERIMEKIDASVSKGTAAEDDLKALSALTSPGPDEAKAADQYLPVMHFVDQEIEKEKLPTTCTGDLVGKPIVAESKDGCASACDRTMGKCVGFAYFKPEDSKAPVCFLLANFKTAFYYTGCKSFLQQRSSKGASASVECLAKLSDFEGTTLKPDGSGKCKECFKKVTKADRCF